MVHKALREASDRLSAETTAREVLRTAFRSYVLVRGHVSCLRLRSMFEALGTVSMTYDSIRAQRGLYLAGFDPGYMYVGYALVRIAPDGSKVVVHAGTAYTEKSMKKGSVRQAADIIRRAKDVWAEIRSVWKDLPSVLCMETLPLLRNSTVRSNISYVAGGLALYSNLLDVPLLEATPTEVKKAVCGNGSASKTAVIARIKTLYPDVVWPTTKAKGLDSEEMASHAADALAAIEACANDPAVIALKHALWVDQ